MVGQQKSSQPLEAGVRICQLVILRRFPGEGRPAFFKISDGVDGHTQVLALFDRGERPETSFRRPPLDHIAFSLSLADLDTERERVIALGYTPQESSHGWVQWRSLYIHDPEGNQVEWVSFDPSVELEPW